MRWIGKKMQINGLAKKAATKVFSNQQVLRPMIKITPFQNADKLSSRYKCIVKSPYDGALYGIKLKKEGPCGKPYAVKIILQGPCGLNQPPCGDKRKIAKKCNAHGAKYSR